MKFVRFFILITNNRPSKIYKINKFAKWFVQENRFCLLVPQR